MSECEHRLVRSGLYQAKIVNFDESIPRIIRPVGLLIVDNLIDRSLMKTNATKLSNLAGQYQIVRQKL